MINIIGCVSNWQVYYFIIHKISVQCHKWNKKHRFKYAYFRFGHTFVVKVHKLNMVFPMEFTSSWTIHGVL
jgi:hypothetical protein